MGRKDIAINVEENIIDNTDNTFNLQGAEISEQIDIYQQLIFNEAQLQLNDMPVSEFNSVSGFTEQQAKVTKAEEKIKTFKKGDAI